MRHRVPQPDIGLFVAGIQRAPRSVLDVASQIAVRPCPDGYVHFRLGRHLVQQGWRSLSVVLVRLFLLLTLRLLALDMRPTGERREFGESFLAAQNLERDVR